MRQVISLSLPPKTVQVLKRNTRRFGCRSASEYIRHLIDSEEHFITEDEVLKEWGLVQRDSKAGRTRTVKSLRELAL